MYSHLFTHSLTAVLYSQLSRQRSRFAEIVTRATTRQSSVRPLRVNTVAKASIQMVRALYHAVTALPVVTTTNRRRTTRQLHASFVPRDATATSLELTLVQVRAARDRTAGPVRQSAYFAHRGGITTWLATESSTSRPMSAKCVILVTTRPLEGAHVVKSRFIRSLCMSQVATLLAPINGYSYISMSDSATGSRAAAALLQFLLLRLHPHRSLLLRHL